MSAHSTVVAEVREGVGHLTLNRPDSFNTIDGTMAAELLDVATEWSADRSVRAVLVRGAGPTFCGGGDLKWLYGRPALTANIRTVLDALHPAVETFAAMDAPIIAAVHGSAAGAGFSLAASCDVVIAAESAKFVLAYPAVGLTPDGSATWFTPRRIGTGRTLDLVLLGQPLSASEALAWGLASVVVADDALFATAESIAAKIATGPTRVFGATKRLLHQSQTSTLHEQLDAETDAIVAAASAPDGQEGVGAFVAKRPARFTGA